MITDSFARWRERLPERVGVGEVPTQTEADAWAERNTKGLITRFPMPLDGLDLVLASAVATDVFWKSPYDVVRASDWFSPVQSVGRRGPGGPVDRRHVGLGAEDGRDCPDAGRWSGRRLMRLSRGRI